MWSRPSGLQLEFTVTNLNPMQPISRLLTIGFAAAAGTAGMALAMDRFRPWFMALSVALLACGVWQLYWRPRVCRKPSRTTLTIFWTCAAVVLTMIVAPQLIAGWLADL